MIGGGPDNVCPGEVIIRFKLLQMSEGGEIVTVLLESICEMDS